MEERQRILCGVPNKRIYSRVVGCFPRNTVHVRFVGAPGVSGSVVPGTTFWVPANLVPMHRRLPNTLVWFDVDESGYHYVGPEEKPISS